MIGAAMVGLGAYAAMYLMRSPSELRRPYVKQYGHIWIVLDGISLPLHRQTIGKVVARLGHERSAWVRRIHSTSSPRDREREHTKARKKQQRRMQRDPEFRKRVLETRKRMEENPWMKLLVGAVL